VIVNVNVIRDVVNGNSWSCSRTLIS